MSTHTSIHSVKEITARAHGSLGAPVTISLVADGGHETEVTFYTDRVPLSRRLADAITDAVKPAAKLTPDQHLIAAELADVLAQSNVSLDEAKAVMRAALGDYENHLENAWQAQQEQFAESGGSDDSAYRRDVTNAGRGHLLR